MTSNEKMASNIANLHPLKRLGRGSDHAAMAAFLLSEKAAWMTGQVIHIDGGRSVVGSI